MKIDFLSRSVDVQTGSVTEYLNKLKKQFKKRNKKAVYIVTKKTVNFLYDAKIIKSFEYASQKNTFVNFKTEQFVQKTLALYNDATKQIKKKGTKRKVVHVKDVEVHPKELWSLITNVEDYPRYIKYMQRSELNGQFELGNKWSDISTVMFYPINVKHEIIDIKEGKEFTFLIRLPFKGKIIQKGIIEDKGDYVSFQLQATIDLGHPLIDLLLGPILEKRTSEMLLGILENEK